MLKEKLPILISVPHGGQDIPDEIQTTCLLNEMDILLDGDTWTKELFAFEDLVEEFHQMDVARIVIDMNRSLTDLPPENPDGIVKTLTVDGGNVWDSPSGLNELERKIVIEKHYMPYHQKLIEGAKNPNVKLAIDCHSMLDYGPSGNGEEWQHRPLFCISNRGTKMAEMDAEPLTAPVEMVIRFKELLETKFQKYAVNDRDFVTLNDPFKGGHVTRYHGNIGDTPWIQLEINRMLYLPETPLLTVEPDDLQRVKLEEFRNILYDVFSELVKGVHPIHGKEAL
ncbi:N-formylglutamate amidohydrolase [Salipaludibacillus daqingensis]|uniref:N-formylglutamate amidohydrolase n=1 Tax=Salipaludibacillus daqingensis TaxID=3041001 RepID=UPI002476869E|nr:N-formylglutamate amidohydrolase [Salipaludibacillus daqingensis]